MSDITETKMIQFSDSILIFQIENSHTQMNHLNDFASKVFENLQFLYFLYFDHQQFFVELVLQLKDNHNKNYTFPLDLCLIV